MSVKILLSSNNRRARDHRHHFRETGKRGKGAVFEIPVPKGAFRNVNRDRQCLPGDGLRNARAEPIAGYFIPQQERILRRLFQ
jgi:hypothetical protein